MSTLARLGLGLAELLCGGVFGAMVGVWWARRGGQVAVFDEAEAAAAQRPLVEASERTHAVFGRALSAHMSLRARLAAVGDSALEHAQALKRLDEVGLAPRGIRANADWRPPPELSRELPRPGAAEAWQALDRSFDAMLAALDDPEASFVEHARAYRAVGRAACEVADGLAGASTLELAAGCSFCAKSRQNVGRLIAGPGVYICDECVALCVEVMEDEAGPNWREQADRRLRGEDEEAG